MLLIQPYKLLKKFISVESSPINHCLLIAFVHSVFNNKIGTINKCGCSALGIMSASRAWEEPYTIKPVVQINDPLQSTFIRFGLVCVSLECTFF